MNQSLIVWPLIVMTGLTLVVAVRMYMTRVAEMRERRVRPALFLTGNVTTLQLSLAWTFVLTRVIHSVVHITYNRVMHRFNAFLLGMVAVFAMWITLALQLARANL
jgi:hypothetical protein